MSDPGVTIDPANRDDYGSKSSRRFPKTDVRPAPEGWGSTTRPPGPGEKACSIPGCGSVRYRRGMCSTHSSRAFHGKPLDAPIRRRAAPFSKCSIDGCARRVVGAGLCEKHYGRKLYREKAQRLVDMLGGRCAGCGGTFPVPVFDFHHRDPATKSFSIAAATGNRSFEEVVEEARKCDLLCANCHRMRHFKGDEP